MKLTEEQLEVVHHPEDHHGKVLAVAGSGKTATMAHRIRYLVQDKGVHPTSIQVLMFNKLARIQFRESLAQVDLSTDKQPAVDTFHSYAYRQLNQEGFKGWSDNTEELAHLCLLQARRIVCKERRLSQDDIDLETAKQAIGLWKGALIPPSRAGYRGLHSEVYVDVYRAFEERRQNEKGLTYDDFVPMALNAISHRQHATHIRHLIVDEYQDVNLGQQRLVEQLAREGADVMVVGDDDQTIYEWRGARSAYILEEFEKVFTNKPHCTYRLTRSFRFGYCIAQSSNNVIAHNTKRLDKHVITNYPARSCDVTLITDNEETGGYANRQLAEEIISLVRNKDVPPSSIRVLGRTYAQLHALQTEFLLRKIPFKVLGGKAPFLQSGENKALLNYVRIAVELNSPVTQDMVDRFPSIANTPSRYLTRKDIQNMLRTGMMRSQTLSEVLDETLQDPRNFSRGTARENLMDLMEVLKRIRQKLEPSPGSKAGSLLDWIDREVGFHEHYEDYYGPGEVSLTRMESVRTFIEYAHLTDRYWQDFIDHVDTMDTTLKRPDRDWIKMMTIHSVKGLEFDYVVIPDCREGYIPVMGSSEDLTFDIGNEQRTPQPAKWIENERRLFYVGITRARKELFLGAPRMPERSDRHRKKQDALKASRFLEELELPVTREVSSAVVLAAGGRSEHGAKLLEVCRKRSAFHHIVGLIKQEYFIKFPKRLRPRLSQIPLSAKKRRWQYRGEYNSPDSNRPPAPEPPSAPDANSWDWIDTSSRRRQTRRR